MISVAEAKVRRQRIKDTAFKLFVDRGVEKVTYRDIAKLSGISETSIYHYYSKKAYLLLDTYRDLWYQISENLKTIVAGTKDFRNYCGYQQVETLINGFEEVYLEHGEYLKFALECKLYWNRKNIMIDKKEYDNILAPIFLQFDTSFKKGIKDCSINVQSDPFACCFVLWGTLRAYMDQIILLDDFYLGENSYREYFGVLKEFIKKSLR